MKSGAWLQIADALYRSFLVPLVLGGEMTPGRPIGSDAALKLGTLDVALDMALDAELASHVALARVRKARSIVAIDRIGDITPPEWALGAVLHDLLTATHPDFVSGMRKRTPIKIGTLCDATLERIPNVATIGDALSRHTWFSRVFDIKRTDTTISWWVGSQTFLGVPPPTRLLAWPEVRRVHQVKASRSIVELMIGLGSERADSLFQTLGVWFRKTPLTDLATCFRDAPRFYFSKETLSFLGARAGRTLALRALSEANSDRVDAALGGAMRAVIATRHVEAIRIALRLLAERAIERLLAQSKDSSNSPSESIAFARSAGALAARSMLRDPQEIFPDDARRRILTRLDAAIAASPRDVIDSIRAALGAPANPTSRTDENATPQVLGA